MANELTGNAKCYQTQASNNLTDSAVGLCFPSQCGTPQLPSHTFVISPRPHFQQCNEDHWRPTVSAQGIE